jgi:uncharacterized membrane protein
VNTTKKVRNSNFTEAAALIFVTLIAAIAVSNQSLWIDEGNSAMKAIQPSFVLFWEKMKELGGSDLQMPLYMVLLWVWEKMLGHSEYALRALNIPFFTLSAAVLLYLWDAERRLKLAFFFLMCFSSMLWVYLDEARPYVLQFFGATSMLVALWNQAKTPDLNKNLAIFCIGTLALCGSSLTGVIFTFWFGIAFLGVLIHQHVWHNIFSSKQIIVALLFTSIGLCGLGIYYFWTLTQGARASGVGKTDLLSIGFCFYELLGFSGLGPDRLSLREHGITALKPFLLSLGSLVVVLTAFGISSALYITKSSRKHRTEIFLFAAVFCGAVSMVAVGYIAHFRVLGRHLMPVLPFILLLLSLGIIQLWQTEKKLSRAVVLSLCLLLMLSCISTRFSARFAKDDYRTAAQVANSSLKNGKTIWWAADSATATYYGLEFNEKVINVIGLLAEELHSLPVPDIVLVSKKDIYDPQNAISLFLSEKSYSTGYAAAFSIYKKSNFEE